LLGVKEHVAQLHARLHILWILPGRFFERLDPRGVDRRRGRRRARRLRRRRLCHRRGHGCPRRCLLAAEHPTDDDAE
jgi:hypothetical protein